MSTKQIKKPVKKAAAPKKVTAEKKVVKEAIQTTVELAGIDPKTNEKVASIHVADIIWGDVAPEVVEELSDLVAQFIGLYLAKTIGDKVDVVEKEPCECCCKKQEKAVKPAKKPVAKKAKKVAK